MMTHSAEGWVIDSGATQHMTNSKEILTKVKPYNNSDKKEIVVANCQSLLTDCRGDVHTNGLKIENVDYVPGLATNLLSVSQMAKKGHEILFKGTNCKIFPKNTVKIKGKSIATGTLSGGLYVLNSEKKVAFSSKIISHDI